MTDKQIIHVGGATSSPYDANPPHASHYFLSIDVDSGSCPNYLRCT
ncbi:MAG: hypothetical protein ACI8T6_001375, partial [Candidatus Poseidoniaceae archaeon]